MGRKVWQVAVESVIESDGEEAGFEAVTAKDGLLGKGDALDGEEFLGVGGTIAGDGVGFEVRDFVEFFEAHDGEGRTAEGVFDEGIFRVEGEIEIGHWLDYKFAWAESGARRAR